MANQPSEAVIEVAYAALLEHERLDLDPPYPTKGDIMLVDPLVVVVADHVERYAAEQVRAARTDALEQACRAVCDECATGRECAEIRGDWWHPIIERDRYYTPPIRCSASAIRALMSDNTKETTHE